MSVPASGLDVAAALAAKPGIGANQHLWPNHAVEVALVRAGLDPTRANWTKGTWGQSELEQGHLGQGHLGQGHLGGRRERERHALGGHART